MAVPTSRLFSRSVPPPPTPDLESGGEASQPVCPEQPGPVARGLERLLEVHVRGHQQAASKDRCKYLALAVTALLCAMLGPLCDKLVPVIMGGDTAWRSASIMIIGSLNAFVVAFTTLMGYQARSEKHLDACVAYSTMYNKYNTGFDLHVSTFTPFSKEMALDFPQFHKECVNKISELSAKTPPLPAKIQKHIKKLKDANTLSNEQKHEADVKQQWKRTNEQKHEEDLKQQWNEKEKCQEQNEKLVENMKKEQIELTEAVKVWRTQAQNLEPERDKAVEQQKELHEQLKEQQTQNQKLVKKLDESNEQQKANEELLGEGDRGSSPSEQGTVEATQRGQMLRPPPVIRTQDLLAGGTGAADEKRN